MSCSGSASGSGSGGASPVASGVARSMRSSIGVAVSCAPGSHRLGRYRDDEVAPSLCAEFLRVAGGRSAAEDADRARAGEVDAAALQAVGDRAERRARLGRRLAGRRVLSSHPDDAGLRAAVRAERDQLAALPAFDVPDDDPVAFGEIDDDRATAIDHVALDAERKRADAGPQDAAPRRRHERCDRWFRPIQHRRIVARIAPRRIRAPASCLARQEALHRIVHRLEPWRVMDRRHRPRAG